MILCEFFSTSRSKKTRQLAGEGAASHQLSSAQPAVLRQLSLHSLDAAMKKVVSSFPRSSSAASSPHPCYLVFHSWCY